MRHIVNRPSTASTTWMPRTLLASLLAITAQAGSAAAQDLRPTLDDAASRWVTVDQVEMGSVDVDTSRVVLLAPDVYQARTRWRFATEQTAREGYRYQTTVAVRAIDCSKRQMAIIAFADHDGSEIVRTEAQPVYAARWDPVNPESIVDRITTRVCEQGRRQETRLSASGS